MAVHTKKRAKQNGRPAGPSHHIYSKQRRYKLRTTLKAQFTRSIEPKKEEYLTKELKRQPWHENNPNKSEHNKSDFQVALRDERIETAPTARSGPTSKQTQGGRFEWLSFSLDVF